MALKYNTFIASNQELKDMVKALRDYTKASKLSMQIEKDNMGYWLRLNKGKHTGKDVFRAMQGSNGTYLVRHVENLFT